jgi:hypothetical protein
MTQPTTAIDPELDGVAYVNVYSKGRTELGRLLTNFAFAPFKHPRYGHFAGLEAFWYWLSTGRQHDKLRRLYGASAKMVGRTLPKVPYEDFQKEICEAI